MFPLFESSTFEDGLDPPWVNRKLEPETFDQTTLRTPIGSGPYVIARIDPGDARLGEAMLQYRRIASLGLESGGDAYWQSVVRTLQILDRVDSMIFVAPIFFHVVRWLHGLREVPVS